MKLLSQYPFPHIPFIFAPFKQRLLLYSLRSEKIYAHSMQDDEQEIPLQYICPISQELMKDPVSVATGHCFERINIESWLHKNNTNPITNLPLPSKQLIPNIPLKQIIQAYKQKQKQKLRMAQISHLMTSYTAKEKQMRQKYRCWQQKFQQKIQQLPNEQFSYGNYKGEIVNSQPHGDGVMNYSDGSTYGGQWNHGERDGFGRIVYNQKKYYGEWKNGKLDGVGWVVSEYTNKIIFRCQWKNGKRSGFGIHYDHENSTVYSGYWKQDRRHGEGKQENTKKGQVFVGQWKDGVKHGQGQTRHRNGTKTKENWYEGEQVGKSEVPKKHMHYPNQCCKIM